MATQVFKIILIGDTAVGKTSIIQRADGDHFATDQPVTLGLDCRVMKVSTPNEDVLLTLWDSAGQERFHSLTHSLFRGAQAILLVYDVGSYASFTALERWSKEISAKTVPSTVVKFVVANKIDLASKGQRHVSTEEGTAWAHQHGVMYAEMSAKTNEGLDATFEQLVQILLSVPRNDRTAGTLSLGGRIAAPRTCC